MSARSGLGTLIGVIAIAVLSVSAPAKTDGEAAKDLSASTYTGIFPRLADARVKLRVFSRGNEAVRVRFRFRRVKLRCDDGRVQVRNLGWRSERFEGRHFDEIEYFDPQSFGIEEYIRIDGRLLRGGKARGSVFYYTKNPIRANHECTTATGVARWRAERRR
jgi:hypothetical protein